MMNILYISCEHYSDVIKSVVASQINGVSIVYSIVCLGADQWKHQSSASLALVWGIHPWPVNSQHKGPVTRKMLPSTMTSSWNWPHGNTTKIPLMLNICQHWLRYWHGAVRHQAITQANIDPDFCRHMTLLSHIVSISGYLHLTISSKIFFSLDIFILPL